MVKLGLQSKKTKLEGEFNAHFHNELLRKVYLMHQPTHALKRAETVKTLKAYAMNHCGSNCLRFNSLRKQVG